MSTELVNDYFDKPLVDVDPEVAEQVGLELRRQQTTLEMIASENFVPQSVLDCQGSVLTNKYAEGYPGRRYYGGCEYVDVVEQLAAAPDREAAVAPLEPAAQLVSRGVRAKPAVVLELLCRHDAELDREAGIGTDLRPVEARLVDDQPAVEGDGERAEEQPAKRSHSREYRAPCAPRPLVPSSRWPS